MKRTLLITYSVLLLAACGSKKELDIEEYLPEDQVTSYVTAQMAKINRAYFKIDGQTMDLRDLDLDEEHLMFLFDEGLIVLGLNVKNMELNGKVGVLYGTLDPEGEFQEQERFSEKTLTKKETEYGIHLKGNLKNKNRTLSIELLVNQEFIGAGASELDIRANGKAYLRGVLGTRTYVQIKNLIEQRPEIKTLVFEEVGGSVNDAINVHTGRLIRRGGLNTHLESTSMIASGGVDLFTAGNQRLVVDGAKVGVHSWCCAGTLTADKLPRDHESHRSQLEYFNFTLGELGTEFYFYTLTSARFDDIHWMSLDDIKKYKVATEVIPN